VDCSRLVWEQFCENRVMRGGHRYRHPSLEGRSEWWRGWNLLLRCLLAATIRRRLRTLVVPLSTDSFPRDLMHICISLLCRLVPVQHIYHIDGINLWVSTFWILCDLGLRRERGCQKRKVIETKTLPHDTDSSSLCQHCIPTSPFTQYATLAPTRTIPPKTPADY